MLGVYPINHFFGVIIAGNGAEKGVSEGGAGGVVDVGCGGGVKGYVGDELQLGRWKTEII